MKKCPECSTIYSDELIYCLNDGTALIEETFSLPSEADSIEAETVVRHEPFVVNLNNEAKIPDSNKNIHVPPVENIVIVPAKPKSNSKKYVLFLFLGLMLGGCLVLAMLLLSKMLGSNENNNAVKTIQTENTIKTVPATENKNTKSAIETISDKHNKATSANDEEFNGRVIAVKARIRSSPSAESSVVGTLPVNDRLNIIERENSNSPWYRVECEHGTTGWMHGNTIEFTR